MRTRRHPERLPRWDAGKYIVGPRTCARASCPVRGRSASEVHCGREPAGFVLLHAVDVMPSGAVPRQRRQGRSRCQFFSRRMAAIRGASELLHCSCYGSRATKYSARRAVQLSAPAVSCRPAAFGMTAAPTFRGDTVGRLVAHHTNLAKKKPPGEKVLALLSVYTMSPNPPSESHPDAPRCRRHGDHPRNFPLTAPITSPRFCLLMNLLTSSAQP